MEADTLLKEAIEATADKAYAKALNLYNTAMSCTDCTSEARAQSLAGLCRVYLRSENLSRAYTTAIDYIDDCPTDSEPYLYASAALFAQAQLDAEGSGSLRRRGQAFAACALQLDSYARQHYLWDKYGLTKPDNVQYIKASSEPRSTTGFTPLDEMLCTSHVVILEEGKHVVTCGILPHPITILGKGKRGGVAVELKRKIFGTENTLEGRCDFAAPVILENLDVLCSTNHAVFCIAGKMQLHNCRLSNSGSSGMPVASVANGAVLTLKNCEVSGSKAAGGIMSHAGGTMELEGCKIFNNLKSGLEAIGGGHLTATSCSIYGNRQGVIVWQQPGKVRLTDCSIYNHTNEGVLVSNCTKGGGHAQLNSCRVYQNGNYGVSVDVEGHASLKGCKIFENRFWGVIVKSKSTLTMDGNEVYSNKCGGVYLGFNGNAPVKLSNNYIHHNAGQGFADIFNSPSEEGAETVKAMRRMSLQDKSRMASMGLLTSSKKPELVDNVMEHNGEMNEHPTRLDDWQRRCSMCQRKAGGCEDASQGSTGGVSEDGNIDQREEGTARQAASKKLKICSGCLSARYCSAQCQKEHWKKHRPECELVRKNHEVVVELLSQEEQFGNDPYVTLTQVKGQRTPKLHTSKGAQTNIASKYPKKCIVKIQTDENSVDAQQFLLAYNEDRSINGWFRSPSIFHFILERGVLGCNGFTSKKVYLNATLEADKKLRILTNQLAPYKAW